MWKHPRWHPDYQIWSRVRRPLAQRPAGGQLHLPETDPGPAPSSFCDPDWAVPDDAFPRRFAVRFSLPGLGSGGQPAPTRFQWLPRGLEAQRGANHGGGRRGVDGVREQEGVRGVSVLQQRRSLRQRALSEWRSLPGGRCWTWVNKHLTLFKQFHIINLKKRFQTKAETCKSP